MSASMRTTNIKNRGAKCDGVTDDAKALQAAIYGPDPAARWCPISTAPSWPCCLVWDPYFGMKVGRFDPLRKQWISDGPYDWEAGGKEIDLHPTHWMPLPSPPTESAS